MQFGSQAWSTNPWNVGWLATRQEVVVVELDVEVDVDVELDVDVDVDVLVLVDVDVDVEVEVEVEVEVDVDVVYNSQLTQNVVRVSSFGPLCRLLLKRALAEAEAKHPGGRSLRSTTSVTVSVNAKSTTASSHMETVLMVHQLQSGLQAWSTKPM